MTDEYIQSCIEHINELIEEIHRGGKRVRALGTYLVLEDALEVKLSDREIK